MFFSASLKVLLILSLQDSIKSEDTPSLFSKEVLISSHSTSRDSCLALNSWAVGVSRLSFKYELFSE